MGLIDGSFAAAWDNICSYVPKVGSLVYFQEAEFAVERMAVGRVPGPGVGFASSRGKKKERRTGMGVVRVRSASENHK